MTDREVFFETVRFGKPDRRLYGAPYHMIGYLGANHESFDDPNNPDGKHSPVGTAWTDIWGTGWVKGQEGVMGIAKIYPLADPCSLDSYMWPDPNDERIYGKIYSGCDEFRLEENKVLTGLQRDPLWEKAHMLVGMENMLEYFYTEPEFVRAVLRRIMDFQLGIAEHYIKAGIEVLLLGDDLGCQDRLLLSPDIINEFLMPEYRRLFDFYKKRGVLIDFHSCGYVEPLLETFIDLGIDILNPLQATANDFNNVIEVTKGRMALRGGVSTRILMTGSDGEIRAAVADAIVILGKYGGYFCQQDQGLPFPPHAIEVLKEAVESSPVNQ